MAAGVEPTPDSVDLISTSSWKIARANCWYCEGDGADVWPPAKQTDTTRQKTAHSADDAAPSLLVGLSAIGGLDYIPLFIKRP